MKFLAWKTQFYIQTCKISVKEENFWMKSFSHQQSIGRNVSYNLRGWFCCSVTNNELEETSRKSECYITTNYCIRFSHDTITWYQDQAVCLCYLFQPSSYSICDNRGDQTAATPVNVYYYRHHDSVTIFLTISHEFWFILKIKPLRDRDSSVTHGLVNQWSSPERLTTGWCCCCSLWKSQHFRVRGDTDTLQKLRLINNSSAMALMYTILQINNRKLQQRLENSTHWRPNKRNVIHIK